MTSSRHEVANVNTTQINNNKAKRRSERRSALGGLEVLETRNLLAANIQAQMIGSVLNVEGTEQADYIYIEQSPTTKVVSVGTTSGGTNLGQFRGVSEIRVYGMGGNDRIDLHGTDNKNPAVVRGTLAGGGGNDVLIGGSGDDHLDGGEGDDDLYGGKGNDLMAGQAGKDELWGNDGNDVMYGGAGGTNPELGGTDNDTLDGGAGNDSIWGGAGHDTLYGDAGEDTLYGGTGDDRLVGEAGADKLFGDAGLDKLFGEFETNYGTSKVTNWLEAGSTSEFAVDGFNAYKPVVNGMQYYDIDQQQSGSCAFLASLAATVKTGRLSESAITYKGNFTYCVKFFDPVTHKEVTQTVKFDGKPVTYFDGKTTNKLDPATPNYEFWTTLYQRAYFKLAYNVDYTTDPKWMDNFKGEHTNLPMARLMPYNFSRFAKGSAEFTAANIKTQIDAGWGVTASLTARSLNTDTNQMEDGQHAYVVTGINTYIGINGTAETFVTLYNPWGDSKLHGTRCDGKTVNVSNTAVSGLFTISWADFKYMADYFAW